MSSATYFVRSCPACGRSVQVKLLYLGMQVRCVHCNCEFKATDPHSESAALDDPVQYWLNFTTAGTANETSFSGLDQIRRPR